jgi:hypothetical protein
MKNMVKTKSSKPKKKRKERGSIPAMIALILAVVSFVLWAIYIPFTFHEIASVVCLAMVLPICLILIIAGLVLSMIALNLGAGKRKTSAWLALLLCILQVIIWVGWIIFGTLWNMNYFD